MGNFTEWIEAKEDPMVTLAEENIEPIPRLNVEQGETCFYDYLPSKSDNNMVFYASESFYVFIRFLYTLYERVIRMFEILQDEEKIILFELLYFACMKCKESSRYEEALNNLFGI